MHHPLPVIHMLCSLKFIVLVDDKVHDSSLMVKVREMSQQTIPTITELIARITPGIGSRAIRGASLRVLTRKKLQGD